MFDKILEKLKKQRGNTSNVSDRTLEDLARSLEPVITTDEMLEKADFTKSLESVDGNLQHHASEAIKMAEKKKEDDQKKKDEEDRKKKDDEKKKQQQSAEDDQIPAWAKTFMETQQNLLEEINGMKSEKVSTNRGDRLKKSLADMPDYYTTPILKGFEKTSFKDDDEFDTYLKDVETARDAFSQSAKEKGISFPSTPPPKKEEESGQTPVLSEAAKVVQKQKEQQTKKE